MSTKQLSGLFTEVEKPNEMTHSISRLILKGVTSF